MMESRKKQLTAFWKRGAQDAWETAQILFAKRRYAFALFFGHLALEKLLKASVVADGGIPPHTHDLRVLALSAHLRLPATAKRQLDTISTFNVRARYDSAKDAFAARATRDYTTRWLTHTRHFYLWLDRQFPR